MDQIFKEYLFTQFTQQKDADLFKECFVIYKKMLDWEANMKLDICYPMKEHHMQECLEMQKTICRIIHDKLGYEELMEFLKNF